MNPNAVHFNFEDHLASLKKNIKSIVLINDNIRTLILAYKQIHYCARVPLIIRIVILLVLQLLQSLCKGLGFKQLKYAESYIVQSIQLCHIFSSYFYIIEVFPN